MKIALLPGDGIGPEIVAEAVKVLKGLDERFEFEEAPFGGAGYEASGRPLPEATLALAQEAGTRYRGGDWRLEVRQARACVAPRAGHSRLAQGAEPIRESAPGGLV